MVQHDVSPGWPAVDCAGEVNCARNSLQMLYSIRSERLLMVEMD
jgi:hypothetical protein